MALDIRAAASNGSAGRSWSAVSIDMKPHEEFFAEVQLRQCPLLYRLSDYSADASYESRELDQLRAEIGSVRTQFPEGSKVRSFLDALHRVCLDAQNGKLNLYAMCD